MESAEELFGHIRLANHLTDNSWQMKQNNQLDRLTSYIYDCRTATDLRLQASANNLTQVESQYAIHRWRNFKRHEACLSLLFEEVPSLLPSSDKFHKTQDFLIEAAGQRIPFDLKVTRYPKSAGSNLSDSELAHWFYQNQSQQGRYHLANRFFVVGQPELALYDLELARKTVSEFSENMSKYRHFITHMDGSKSRAVILLQRL